jgi:hypothetical protein
MIDGRPGLRHLEPALESGGRGVQKDRGDEAGRMGKEARPPELSGVDYTFSAALETLRAVHLTPAAGASELCDLLAALEALSLIANGLMRTDVAWREHGPVLVFRG